MTSNVQSRSVVSAALIALSAYGFSQNPPKKQAVPAPPVIPQTAEVVLPSPLVLPPPHEIELGQRPLTVQEAVSIALSRQPQIGVAQGNLLSAQGRAQQARSGLLPHFDLAGGYNDQRSLNGSFGSSVAANPYSLSVNVNQLLFDFGRTRDQARQQAALERATLLQLSATRQTVTLQVKQAFYDLAQNRANVLLGEADVSNRQRQLDEARARVVVGIGAPSDLLQAKSNLADAAIALASARDAALTSQVTLAQDLGVDPRTPLTPAPSSEATPGGDDLDTLVSTALKNRPDVLAAREQVTAAELGVSGAKKGNLPQFSVSAGVGGRGPNDPFTTQTASVGVNVAWSFSDGGFVAGQIKEARGAEKSARENLLLVSQQVVSDVSLAYLDLESARQREALAQVAVSNADELVRISEGRYDGGIGLFLDISNAQTSLVSAQRSLTQAQGDIQRAQARLRSALGLPR